jgi:hypothetical protein
MQLYKPWQISHGAGAGTPYGPATRINASFSIHRLKKYRQKYRHFSK